MSANRLLRIVWTIVVTLSASAAPGQNAPGAHAGPGLPPAAMAQLDKLLAGAGSGTQAALVVADASSGAVVYGRNSDALLKPASVQKLFSTAAALARWPADFAFETQLFVVGTDLWVIGGGDPALGDPRLSDRAGARIDQVFVEWAAALRDADVAAVDRIILDDSVFDAQHRHPDWPDAQSDRWYQAPVGGLNFNNNCVEVTLAVADGRVAARLTPELPPDWLENRVRLGRQQKPILRRQAHRDVIELAGTVVRGGELDPVSVNRPTLFFGHALRTVLRREGLEVRGGLVPRTPELGQPGGARRIATHRTPLTDVVWRCNTFSQNLFAESLSKALAAYGPDGRRSGVSAGWDAGREVLRRELGALGVALDGAAMRDGSGLSHANRVSAATIVRLLVAIRRHPRWPAFEASLARAGELGSMNRRYGADALRGRLIGKTGTLRDVSTLAGYATGPDGRVLAFALLINGPGGAGLPVRVGEVLAGAGAP